MKKGILTMMMGLVAMVSGAQVLPVADSTKEKADEVHFRVNYKGQKGNGHTFGTDLTHMTLRHKYHSLTAKELMKQETNGGKLAVRKKTATLPLLTGNAFYGALPGTYNRQPDICACNVTRLYQCPVARISHKSFYPAKSNAAKKLEDISAGDDGGLDVGISENTSFRLDLGYTKLSAGEPGDMTLNMDSGDDDSLDISIGFEFGIR